MEIEIQLFLPFPEKSSCQILLGSISYNREKERTKKTQKEKAMKYQLTNDEYAMSYEALSLPWDSNYNFVPLTVSEDDLCDFLDAIGFAEKKGLTYHLTDDGILYLNHFRNHPEN